MRILLLLAIAGLSAPAHSQSAQGIAVAVDGDTLDVEGMRVRLFGIDAPEARQSCEREGQSWHCGEEATALLRALLQRGAVSCQQQDVDAYGRSVAICSVGRIDLSEAMVRAGMAVPLTHFSEAYVSGAEAARNNHLGIWAGTFEEPGTFRASQPQNSRGENIRLAQHDAAAHTPVLARSISPSVYFRNCTAARTAGMAPLYRGEPGYRPQLDADNDGIACEPYRGR
jgi:endonuclease YncB( thermonuclease family)